MADRLERDEDRRDRLAIAIGQMAASMVAGRYDFKYKDLEHDALSKMLAHDAAILLFYSFREADQVFKT